MAAVMARQEDELDVAECAKAQIPGRLAERGNGFFPVDVFQALDFVDAAAADDGVGSGRGGDDDDEDED